MSAADKSNLLVEIGTEELPPKALRSLSEAFLDAVSQRLSALGLSFASARPFAAPRRLAILVEALDRETPSKQVVNWGPPTRVAFDDSGNPSRAAEAFAAKNGLAVDKLRDCIENDGKQDKLCFRTTEAGQPVSRLLGELTENALAALPIPKRMRWGAKKVEFVRPVHWVVMLLDDKTVPATVMGLQAGNCSRGHRFHSKGEISIGSASSYPDELRKAYVVADFSERREIIRSGVVTAAKQAGGTVVIDDELLDEVTALNEWPVPLLGRFDDRFLEVPAEALISSMKEHQKYFHVVDDNGKLLPLFITVANLESRDPAQVISGNERVIRPRLADAAFFYQTDLKTSLADRRESLKSIVFQTQLGSIYDKTARVANLAEQLATKVGAEPLHARRAGELCKSDLVSEMVLEFDKLQGIMGRYYALNDGEHPEVAEALMEQYLPRFSGDKIPATATGAALALADRIDTLVGIFGIGQKPSGSRDPFALRRASLGVLRIIVERGIDLDLRSTIDYAALQYGDSLTASNLCEQVLTYMLERFRAWYEDENIAPEVFLSVAAKNLGNPLDIHQRVHAVQAFSQLPEAAALAAANKRVSNILAREMGIGEDVDSTLLTDPAEKNLALELSSLNDKVQPLLAQRDYTNALKQLARLREPVDRFFDDVMVMVDDAALRSNRLTLLLQLRNLFLEVADISLLVPAK